MSIKTHTHTHNTHTFLLNIHLMNFKFTVIYFILSDMVVLHNNVILNEELNV